MFASSAALIPERDFVKITTFEAGMNYIAPVSSACYAGLAADAQPPGERVDDSVKVHAGDTDAAHPLIVIPATRVSCWFLTSSHSLFHPRLTQLSSFSAHPGSLHAL